jgi:hypothetical protein
LFSLWPEVKNSKGKGGLTADQPDGQVDAIKIGKVFNTTYPHKMVFFELASP